MESIGNISNSKKRNSILKRNYMLALEDNKFVKLVNSLKTSEEVLIKNTSKLEETVKEINNCTGCKGLEHCENKITGCVYFPDVNENNLLFSYKACKYKKKEKKEKNNVIFYETPLFLKNASMKEIYVDDKKRIPLVKYIKDFLNDFEKDKKTKGIYLYGSFGSGKSYILSAVINELSKKGYSCVNIYYPTMLKVLKESFNDDFDEKLNILMKADVILIDDLGAENNTGWSRDEILGTILQYRMDNEKTTFFTSNFNLEELEEHFKVTSISSDAVKSRRIIERIKQLSNPIELISDNKRK